MYNDQNCYYDWGDDPSFFAASEFFGDVQHATWGVCRPDVRGYLKKAGDYVVFFCAKSASGPVREYFYIGVGTVSFGLNREDIWSNARYARYRDFFNILARPSLVTGELEPYEIVSPFHDDWKKRCEEPYWVFDPEWSQFNLVDPLHVATYTGTEGPVETWRSSQDQQVKRLETLLFPPSAPRRLRINSSPTTHKRPRNPHREIKLQRQLGRRTDLNALRSDLIALAKPRCQKYHKFATSDS